MSLLRQSPIRYRSASLTANSNDSAMKMMGSTSSSFANRVPQTSSPSYSNGFMRRTSSSLTKGTQNKLDNLKEDLDYLLGDIIDTKNTTKQATLYLKFMKEDFNDKRLPQIQSDLKVQIQSLKKQIGISQRSDKLKYDGIWQTIAQLERNSRTMSTRLFQLRNYLSKLQNNLGYYSGAEKHKY